MKKQESPQHKCRLCGIAVCNLFCSIQDPNSDNEIHRVHLPGLCRSSIDENFLNQNIAFNCPKCEKTFLSTLDLQNHLSNNHEAFQTSFPSMSLISEGSLSDIQETCNQCEKLFENELDLKNHVVRVHEYGESFEIYPCEECGYRGQDLNQIRSHVKEVHNAPTINTASETESDSDFESDSLEDLGITKLPEVTGRRKQNLSDLVIDANGFIDVEDESDEDFDARNEEVVEEDDWDNCRRTRSTRGAAVKEKESINKKRKATIEPKGLRKKARVETTISNKSSLQCSVCDAVFTRKDNLIRHTKNKHK